MRAQLHTDCVKGVGGASLTKMGIPKINHFLIGERKRKWGVYKRGPQCPESQNVKESSLLPPPAPSALNQRGNTARESCELSQITKVWNEFPPHHKAFSFQNSSGGKCKKTSSFPASLCQWLLTTGHTVTMVLYWGQLKKGSAELLSSKGKNLQKIIDCHLKYFQMSAFKSRESWLLPQVLLEGIIYLRRLQTPNSVYLPIYSGFYFSTPPNNPWGCGLCCSFL